MIICNKNICRCYTLLYIYGLFRENAGCLRRWHTASPPPKLRVSTCKVVYKFQSVKPFSLAWVAGLRVFQVSPHGVQQRHFSDWNCVYMCLSQWCRVQDHRNSVVLAKNTTKKLPVAAMTDRPKSQARSHALIRAPKVTRFGDTDNLR